MTRPTLTLALLATAPLVAAPLAAQTITTPPNAPHTSTWSAASIARYDKVRVVTIAAPGVRQTCRQPSLTEATLTCKRRLRRPITFNRTDVAAILSPPASDGPLALLMGGWLALGGGTIYGGILLAGVALAGGIPVILLGSFIVITTPVLALGADGDRPETLLYQNTNTPLTIQVGH